MDVNKIPLFASITRRMNWLNHRQKVLAENIANANTPGYKIKELKEPSFRDIMRSGSKVRLVATSPSHISPPAIGGGGDFTVRKSDKSYGASPNGNNVVLEQQLLKVAETRMDYNLMTNLYRKHMGMLRTALGRK
jgi:flagellar basal-body rod protein FlgB